MAYESRKQIRFAHCDPAGVVFSARFAELFNEVVEDWFADGLGVAFRALHEEYGLGLPTVRLEVEYLAPSRYGEVLTFRLEVVEIGNASMRIEIGVWHGEQLRVRGRLKLVMVSMKDFRPVPIDEKFWRPKFAVFAVPGALREH